MLNSTFKLFLVTFPMEFFDNLSRTLIILGILYSEKYLDHYFLCIFLLNNPLLRIIAAYVSEKSNLGVF